MAATPSKMLELGTPLPEFMLPNVVDNQPVSSRTLRGKPCVIAIICNHCPFVKHVRSELAAFGRDCQKDNVGVVAISCNDVQRYPADGPGEMAKEAKSAGYSFPYLFDENQSVTKSFRAVCTPEFYLFDQLGKLAYRGQFDSSRPGNGVPVTGDSLRQAVAAVIAGEKPSADQVPSVGCSIKWKPGNAPDYL